MPSRFLWVLEATYSTNGNTIPVYMLNILEGASFEWDPEQERILPQLQVVVQAALVLGPHDPEDPLVLRMCGEKDVMNSLWQVSL